MTTPVKRYTQEVSQAVTVGGGASPVTVTFMRPTGPAAVFPAGPFNPPNNFNADPVFAPAITPTAPFPAPVIPATSTKFPNLLAQPSENYLDLGGICNVRLTNAALLIATVFLTKVNIVDDFGNVVNAIFSGSLALNDASIAALLSSIPVLGHQAVQLVLTNAGGAVTGAATARYDIGLNAQQPQVSTQASL